MGMQDVNQALLSEDTDPRPALPHLAQLEAREHVFEVDIGLDALPNAPGVILVRGPRQYGKSTWLEGQIAGTVAEYGPGCALYLNGDELADADALGRQL
ncbi:MAG: ATP-binding protein, partial [Deltaproteobacteria bacterium]|nr:ATP-binding protein [Deltaproteobacteria bacterium]